MDEPENRMVDLVYAAAASEASWDHVAVELARFADARSAFVFCGNLRTGNVDLLVTQGPGEREREAYARHWFWRDPWKPFASNTLAERIRFGSEAIPDRELVRTAYYCDFSRGLGIHHLVGAATRVAPDATLAFTLHRPGRESPFEETERRRLEILLPHLRRAAQLSRRLSGAVGRERLSLAALDALAAGVVLLDADGSVAHANGAAEALGRAKDGIVLGGRAERRSLEAAHPGDRTALRSAIRNVLDGGSGAAMRLRRVSGAAPLAALVSPMPERFADAATKRRRMAAVFLSPLDAPGPDPALLQDLFGLAPAEARVAADLAAGATAQAVADTRRVSEATVRTQVRRALEKAGAENLRQLVRMASLAGIVRR